MTVGHQGAGTTGDLSGRRMPVLFVSHGVPASLLDVDYTNALRRFSARQLTLGGIVVISAHWESLRPVRVTRTRQLELLRDFGTMPAPVDRITYQYRGDFGLADRVINLLRGAGISALPEPSRGLDHGAWLPLSIAYPTARVPVVQVSLPVPAETEDVLAMGRALAPLRHENILIIGSGGLVHNLHRLRFDAMDAATDPWAIQFAEWVREHVGRLDVPTLVQYRRLAPHALEAAPTPEHFLPLFFVLGTLESGDRMYELFDGFRYGSLSMCCFVLAGRPNRQAP